ncbi:hypothetical protein [Candidatus Venteria ishoeyi]|uniref:Uncharacterized protein n=1 Tax=Candidatus Venteria ishoeyi TaxID=1899563 RepID=A0A1H6F998_9GAMM|nr:hypothetical protein [Candidatus Venteria ishoeyi]MDM8547450.1 hypothetical protein [Candidatus Venteria ishoeyi]SEH06183.1 Uncharacterised protein [Candidatus Venteria ishoeyi]
MSMYEYLHEIKKETGWSQERISIESGLALSTIGRIFRKPGYTVNETSNMIIRELHQRVVPSAYPEYLNLLFKQYADWKERFSKKMFREHMNTLEVLLKNHQALDAQNLNACRLQWLLGHIYFDHAFYFNRNAPDKWAEKASYWYQRALIILEQTEYQALTLQRYKVCQCLVATRFNQTKPAQRQNNPELRQWLRDITYLQNVEVILNDDYWNWMVARNGLVAASILQDMDYCQKFWKIMCAVSREFEDLAFVPGKEMGSILKDPDLQWFCQNHKGSGIILCDIDKMPIKISIK